jgi:hypothetical protein
MNNAGITVVGLSALLGILKKVSPQGTSNVIEAESYLKKHFAIPENKSIPTSYLEHELSRFTILPENLRTEDQKIVIKFIKELMKKK